jgi:hypothetical protein
MSKIWKMSVKNTVIVTHLIVTIITESKAYQNHRKALFNKVVINKKLPKKLEMQKRKIQSARNKKQYITTKNHTSSLLKNRI